MTHPTNVAQMQTTVQVGQRNESDEKLTLTPTASDSAIANQSETSSGKPATEIFNGIKKINDFAKPSTYDKINTYQKEFWWKFREKFDQESDSLILRKHSLSTNWQRKIRRKAIEENLTTFYREVREVRLKEITPERIRHIKSIDSYLKEFREEFRTKFDDYREDNAGEVPCVESKREKIEKRKNVQIYLKQFRDELREKFAENVKADAGDNKVRRKIDSYTHELRQVFRKKYVAEIGGLGGKFTGEMSLFRANGFRDKTLDGVLLRVLFFVDDIDSLFFKPNFSTNSLYVMKDCVRLSDKAKDESVYLMDEKESED